MYVVWKILGTLGCYVDNEIIPLKIIYLYFKIELWPPLQIPASLCKGPTFYFMSFTLCKSQGDLHLSLFHFILSKNHAPEGFIPFGIRLIFLFFEILKQAIKQQYGLGLRLIG